jgi:hypothetical protein
MTLPFTLEQFLGVFAAYNRSIWPIQVLLNALGILAILLCFRSNVPSRSVSAILAVLWIWTGTVYHLLFFSSINPAAFLFGGLFIVQGALFFTIGVVKQRILFDFQRTLRGFIGVVLLLYGLLVYPILGYVLGHVYPYSPTFGAPCPTTIFTFGLLLWTTNRERWYLLVLPGLWSVVGFIAALKLGIQEDIGLLVAGIAGTILLSTRRDSPTARLD